MKVTSENYDGKLYIKLGRKYILLEQENERLKQENAELKDDNKVMADNYSKMEQKFYNQLTKLKGIVKRFLEFVNNEVEYDPENPEIHTKMWNELCEEAEQFLKDSEVKNEN